MKATFVGGGAYRILNILRGAMHDPRLFDGGEIALYDLDLSRAETMARMLAKTPEFAHANCRVSAVAELGEALSGADSVGVIFPAGSYKSARLGDEISWRHGFVSSDNVSPAGAMHGLKAGPSLLNIARHMERYCPDAWLIDFVNPVAVFAGMVCNHTKINAMGVCQGFTNHQWDIARLLGEDKQLLDLEHVEVAGINHLSFILRCERGGVDVLKLLRETLAGDWRMPPLSDRWEPWMKENINNGVTKLGEYYKQLGVLIFSTEGDGMDHLAYDQAVEDF